MGKTNVEPYLFFKGNCAEAMEFYKSIFGGEIESMSYGSMPGPIPEGLEGKLMHASLSGGEVNLMASDTLQASDKSAKISISLGGDDEAMLTEFFNKLSDGADVQNPLKKEVWGDIFGSLTDKFGVEWMINISKEG